MYVYFVEKNILPILSNGIFLKQHDKNATWVLFFYTPKVNNLHLQMWTMIRSHTEKWSVNLFPALDCRIVSTFFMTHTNDRKNPIQCQCTGTEQCMFCVSTMSMCPIMMCNTWKVAWPESAPWQSITTPTWHHCDLW